MLDMHTLTPAERSARFEEAVTELVESVTDEELEALLESAREQVKLTPSRGT